MQVRGIFAENWKSAGKVLESRENLEWLWKSHRTYASGGRLVDDPNVPAPGAFVPLGETPT